MTDTMIHQQRTFNCVRDELGVAAIQLWDRGPDMGDGRYELVPIGDDGMMIERTRGDCPRRGPINTPIKKASMVLLNSAVQCPEHCQWIMRVWELE